MLAVVRPADPVTRDRLLAALAFVAMAGEFLASGGSATDVLRSLLFAALLATPLLWWRTRPEVVALAEAAVLLVANTGAAPDRVGDASTPLIPILVSIFGLALYSTGRPLRIAAPATLLLLCAAAVVAES